MVEVDPKLFVTCRLCLDVEGHFQIVPSVQQHIKFCFDIDVQPFDRLPQLICKKCDNILKEYYAIKKKFTDKQEELKAKLQNNEKHVNKSPLPQLEESDSSNSKVKVITRKRKHKTKKAKKKRILNQLLSSSNDDLEVHEFPIAQLKEKCSVINCKSAPWETKLTKYFACRICSQMFNNIEDIKEHTNEHIQIRTKHKNIFNTSCLVVMEKIDGKPNFTNDNKSVVYSSDCIFQNEHNSYYYTVYYPTTNHEPETKNHSNPESSDSEIFIRKRIRLLSKSSSDTIIIHRNCQPDDDASQVTLSKNNVQSPTVIDCIDIESSGTESDNSNNKNKTMSKIIKDDPKTIHNIVKMCYNRYVKRIECMGRDQLQNDEPKESFLQHKVLSIGRKIINNRGFNCTGLLRFLEYKNLNIIWKETNIFNAGSDGKFVQIGTRIRGNDKSEENNLGWKNFYEFPLEEDASKRDLSFRSQVKKICQVMNKSNTKPLINEEENIYSLDNLPQVTSVFSHPDLEISKTTGPDSTLKKLLNSSPVSNPKQLPKKTNEISVLKVFSGTNKISSLDNQTDENIDIDRSMPIITSSMSLNPLPENNTEMNSIITCDEISVPNNELQMYKPRIKVKPVSELMPEKPQNYVNTINDCNSHNHINTKSNNNSTENVSLWSSHTFLTSGQQNNQQLLNSISQSSNKMVSTDYITLDTVQFPNTRTTSPFIYLQNLLLVHNISLLDSYVPLPPNMTCLIKLKIVYQQESCQSVTLSLSLYSSNSTFAIKVQDMQSRDVNIRKLSANWQWQLLKIYNDEVAAKVLLTASRISEKTYDCTKTFFTLLNSIKHVQDVNFVGYVS